MFDTFENVEPDNWPVHGIGMDKQSVQVHGRGNINIMTLVDGVWHAATIHDVLYAPKLGGNLFSVDIAADCGINSTFTNDHVKLVKNGKTLIFGICERMISSPTNRGCPPVISTAKLPTQTAASVHQWHQRLGHSNKQTIKKMAAF